MTTAEEAAALLPVIITDEGIAPMLEIIPEEATALLSKMTEEAAALLCGATEETILHRGIIINKLYSKEIVSELTQESQLQHGRRQRD